MQGKWLLSSQLCSTLNHTVWSGCISSPTGSCAKAYIWQAFKPRLQNMCWRKGFKILRKQSFILESLLTWDNKLPPRIGSIHQENTTTQHTLAGACLSAITPHDYYLSSVVHLRWASRLRTFPRRQQRCRGQQTVPHPEEALEVQMTSRTLQEGLPGLSYRSTRKHAAGIRAHGGDGRKENLGAPYRSSTSPLER